MKKSLLKKLTRMARDGDPEAIEALAEAVEEIMENPSGAPETTVAIAAGTEPEPAAEPAETAGETPAETADEDILPAILERLDRVIALLSPAETASDDDPLPGELAEIIEEAVEAAEPDTAGATAEEIASLVEKVADPAVSTVLEQESDGDGEESCGPSRETGDALRAALRVISPMLKRMPRSERRHVCQGIAANLKITGMDSGAYAALMAAGPCRGGSHAGLGKKIMASRNPNYK